MRGVDRQLWHAGFTTRESASLAALLVGPPPTAHGWTISQVEGLLFVRELVRQGRMGS